MPLDDVTANKLAGDAENYTVWETFTFGDVGRLMLISVLPQCEPVAQLATPKRFTAKAII